MALYKLTVLCIYQLLSLMMENKFNINPINCRLQANIFKEDSQMITLQTNLSSTITSC